MVAQLSLLTRIFEFMSRQPTDEEILNIKASSEEEARLEYLASRNLDSEGLSEREQDELKEFLLAQHLMIIAKGHASGRLKAVAN